MTTIAKAKPPLLQAESGRGPGWNQFVNALIACFASMLFALSVGCKEKKPQKASVSAVVSGRRIDALVDGSGAFIHTDGDTATVRFRGHKVRVERARVLLDNTDTANIASNITLVEIAVTKQGSVTVTADGAKVMNAKLRR